MAQPETDVVIAGPEGDLQARWQPAASGERVAVICHPHPLYGGSMDNKVVTTLARTWRDAGHGVLRFNFRGVGGSAGQHDQGRGEQDDLLAVLRWLQATQTAVQLDVAGFSFGAWVAAVVASQRLPAYWVLRQLLLVAPPVHYEGFASLHPPAGTRVLQGEADDVVAAAAVADWVASRPVPPELQCFAGAGHFFHGQLGALKAAVAAGL